MIFLTLITSLDMVYGATDRTDYGYIETSRDFYYTDNDNFVAITGQSYLDRDDLHDVHLKITKPSGDVEIIIVSTHDDSASSFSHNISLTKDPEYGLYIITSQYGTIEFRVWKSDPNKKIDTINKISPHLEESVSIKIAIRTDRTTYVPESDITISGEIFDKSITKCMDKPIVLFLMSENDNRIDFYPISLESDCSFSKLINTNVIKKSDGGIYKINLNYKKQIFETSFEIMPVSVTTGTPAPTGTTGTVSVTTGTPAPTGTTGTVSVTTGTPAPTGTTGTVSVTTGTGLPVATYPAGGLTVSGQSALTKGTETITTIIILSLLIITIGIGVFAWKKSHKHKPPSLITPISGPRTQYYECPKCHDPNIVNRKDGTTYCDKCKFSQ